jgi:hypothetical protein
MRRLTILIVLAAGFVAMSAGTAQAQILIWSLPKNDKAWVRYEGTHKQSQARPESNAGDEKLEWRSELTISSLGTTRAMFEGKEVPCRWVEFKSITKPEDLEKPPGPGGVKWYKVLIPESRVTGKVEDDEKMPVTFLPIVKGYRKVSGRDVEQVSERVLTVYPTIAFVDYYPDLKQDTSEPATEQLAVSPSPVPVRVMKGSRVLQNDRSRSTNSATLWLSDAVPFGLAKFRVTTTYEEKGQTAAVSDFRRKSAVEVQLSAVAQGTDAKSELPESN